MAEITFALSRNPYGKLLMTTSDGQVIEGVAPVRAFPIQSPDEGISLVQGDGKEVAWIEHLNDLPPASRALLTEELEGREFMPEIARVKSVSSYATPCTWQVDTDRGETQFVLKGEEDIRRIGAASLLIADSHGIQFLIRDMFTIDKQTRKILDRFL
ncbi:DUF1854 domain-containing protein [Janthinobacterium sp. RB2R34]|uniref:cyanophycin metabolism-associated DUF1854 family protein n=1 Tax=Janthinobacterium sp. RB2R34 TaxID=3424193 RepID=UPI003F23C73C